MQRNIQFLSVFHFSALSFGFRPVVMVTGLLFSPKNFCLDVTHQKMSRTRRFVFFFCGIYSSFLIGEIAQLSQFCQSRRISLKAAVCDFGSRIGSGLYSECIPLLTGALKIRTIFLSHILSVVLSHFIFHSSAVAVCCSQTFHTRFLVRVFFFPV